MNNRRWPAIAIPAALVLGALGSASALSGASEAPRNRVCVGIVVRDEPHPMTGSPMTVIYRAWEDGAVEALRNPGKDNTAAWEEVR